MAVSHADPTYNGKTVTVIEAEQHRDDTMLYIEYTEGEYKGSRRWVFEEDLD